MNSNYFDLRVAGLVICFVGGFFFWPLFIACVIIVATLSATPEEQHESARPKPKAALVEKMGIKAEDHDWINRYLEACESPAEMAFLTAMIESFSLKPIGGVLSGAGLTLNLQVDMGRYRLDFLANGWLVIEVDGAAWHSSPEAIARDKKRDEFFKSYEYTVLRIPAKVVFSTPDEAVRRVRASLSEGRQIKVIPPQKAVSARESIGAFLRNTALAVEDINASVERSKAVQEAMSAADQIYHTEKTAIVHAMNHADSIIKRKRLFAEDPEIKVLYEKNLSRYNMITADGSEERDSNKEIRQHFGEKIIPINAPEPHPNADIDEAIKRKFSCLMEDRASYFDEVWQALKEDEDRRTLVQQRLLELNCSQCWDAIASPISSSRVVAPHTATHMPTLEANS